MTVPLIHAFSYNSITYFCRTYMYTILSIYNTSVHIFILHTFYFRVLVHLQKAVSSTILYICICMYIIFDSLGNYYFTTFLLSSHAVWYNNYIPSCISKSLYVTMGHMHKISNYAFTRICLIHILLNSTKFNTHLFRFQIDEISNYNHITITQNITVSW